MNRTAKLIGAALLAVLVFAPAALGGMVLPRRGQRHGQGVHHARRQHSYDVALEPQRHGQLGPEQLSGGPSVAGYVVKRYDTSGALQSIGSACDTTITALTCTETAVPAGSWRYSVTPRQGLWSGAESAQSSTVTVDPPTLNLSSSNVPTVPATRTGTIDNWVPGQTVTFRLDDPTTGTILAGSITPASVPASGSAAVSVTLPAGTSNGSHTIYAVGSGGDVAAAGVTVGPAFVKNIGQASCGSTSLNVSIPASGVPVGNTLILRLALRGASAAAIAASDTRGNSYVLDGNQRTSTQRVAILHARVTTALTSADSITVTFPSSTGAGLVVDEFSNVAAGAAHASGAASGTSAAPSVSATTSTTPTLLIGAVSIAGQLTATQPGTFTGLTGQSLACGPVTNVGGRSLVTTAGPFSYAPSMSASGLWTAVMVAYRAG